MPSLTMITPLFLLIAMCCLPPVTAHAMLQSCHCMQGSGTDGDRTATMLLAAFAVVLGVCAVLGGLAVWKVLPATAGVP